MGSRQWIATAAVGLAMVVGPCAAIARDAPATAIAISDANAIELDGRLVESVWDVAPVIDQFVQREPDEGAAPSFRTEARVAYDATNLYVGIRAFDPDPSAIVGLLTRRDQKSPSDWLRVAIDSYHDRRTAYEFAVNPVGVKIDTYHYNDRDQDVNWDAVWDVVVSIDEEGSKAEFQIPFSQLRFDRNGGGTFGFPSRARLGASTKPPRGRCSHAAPVAWSRSSGNSTGCASRVPHAASNSCPTSSPT